MFKKTLLAVAVATVAASTVNAATIYSSVTETLAVDANFTVGDTGAGLTGEALGIIAGQAGLVLSTAGNCEVVATDLGVTLVDATTQNTAADDGDTVTNIAVDGVLTPSTIVTQTGVNDCTVLLADTAATTPGSASIEAVNAVGTSVSLTAAVVVGPISSVDLDLITLTISGASFDTSATGAATADLVQTDGTGILGTATVFDVTASTLIFTLSDGQAAGTILVLKDAILSASGLTAASEVTVSSKLTRGGVDLDAGASFLATNIAPQYSSKVTKALNGVIDVASDRQALTTTAGDLINTDTLTFAVKKDVTGTSLVPDFTTYSINGDFAWLSESAQTTVDAVAVTPAELATYLTGFYVGTGDDTLTSVSLNADMDKLTVVTAAVNGDIDTASSFKLTVDGKGTGNPVLVEGDYSISAVVTDTTAVPVVLAAGGISAAGSWSLNGSVIEIPYVPFGDNTQVIMRQTVTGTQSGDISVRYMLEGVDTTWNDAGVIGTATPGLQNIADLVIDAIKLDSGETKGKVAIEITSNVGTEQLSTYVAYKVVSEQDRGFIGQF